MTDAWLMGQTLALAALGEGGTRPNPLVGALVVSGNEVVGSGYHRAAGAPHAETLALAAAGARARGGTLYVNLEPCAHQGRTPPCVDALLAAGIARAVVALSDPNPLVDGRGIEALRRGGVTVEVGLLAAEARRLNAAFLSLHERGRPFVTLKAASTWDGRIAAAGGSSTWVTGEPARRHAHRLRLTHDAVLVGAGTIRRDDPRLTARLDGDEVARQVVVLAPRLALDPGAKIFMQHPRPRIYASSALPHGTEASLTHAADVVRVASGPAGLDLEAVLRDLAAHGVQSVLVEGGGRTHASFLAAGLADEIVLFVAPRIFGSEGATPLVTIAAASDPGHAWKLSGLRTIAVGSDRIVVATPER